MLINFEQSSAEKSVLYETGRLILYIISITAIHPERLFRLHYLSDRLIIIFQKEIRLPISKLKDIPKVKIECVYLLLYLSVEKKYFI